MRCSAATRRAPSTTFAGIPTSVEYGGAFNQLVDKLNRINIRIAEVEERQDCVEDKIGMSLGGAASSESFEARENPASKQKH